MLSRFIPLLNAPQANSTHWPVHSLVDLRPVYLCPHSAILRRGVSLVQVAYTYYIDVIFPLPDLLIIFTAQYS